MNQTFQIRGFHVTFLKRGEETEGRFSLCEFLVPPHYRTDLAHIHPDCDQLVVGMEGLTLWTVGSDRINVGPGERLFIPRGSPHIFANTQAFTTRFALIYTPASIGPEIYLALAEGNGLEGEEYLTFVHEVMRRFNVIPVTGI